MNREARPILAAIAAAAVVVVVVLALRGGSVETTVLPPVTLPPPGDVGPSGSPVAVVVSLREDQETSFLGLVRGETHYLVDVQFYAPPGCSNVIERGDPWPRPDVECSSEVAIAGVVSGLGIARTGEAIVLVEVETSEECFITLERGDNWPPDARACALDAP